MKKKIIMLLTVLCISTGAFGATIDEILGSFSNLQSYRADFRQITEIENFGKDEYVGRIYVINKYRALWDYSYPYRQYYLFTSDRVDYYDSEIRQLVRQKNAEGNQNAITRLMLDIGNIRKNFHVTLGGNNVLNLVPLSDIGVRYIKVETDGSRITKVISEDPTGNKTEVTFTNIQLNADIDKKVFEPTVPPGTEVFEYN
ncbi:MAG: outer-membrane lipoprotein carrier protein LolA [Geovibrio sp.]|jgi:outer membrane lipoprotein carrier protein|uniref:LolA family protein n=1 Tax=Geovibrio ferrireducens TaxID=46201 RepID=UPI0022461F6D|nr:outer-membrane lipoprotein carrier protein LolA [Geovibrio ferrireducens]MCD8492247.1 outer-membrane lipoprotein carrier protein LolA [Geovibrio sp.]